MTYRERMKFWVFLLGALCLAVVFSAAAIAKSETDGAGVNDGSAELITPESSKFIVIDVSGLPRGNEKTEVSTDEPSMGSIGPLASVPSMTHEEVDLIDVLPGTPFSSDPKSPDEKMVKTIDQKHWKEITVKPGATLSSIAETYGISAEDIARANELKDRHKLREGQVLYIPDNADKVLETLHYVRFLREQKLAERKQASPIKVTAYVVQNGDTLWSIANAFDLDVNSLFGSNKLNDVNVLKPGKTIRVPNQDGIFVKLKKNDTLKKLANEYNIFVSAIAAANGFNEDAALSSGAEIFLPGAKAIAFVDSERGKSAVSGNAGRVERTVRGFGWPVIGQISSSFGWRRDPFNGGRDYHTGVDIRAPRGRTIVAAAAGQVVYSGWMSGYGKTVVVNHPGGATTLYAHCSSTNVRSGQQVRRGQAIAGVGSTGRSTGNHLHFEIRRNGSPVNPLKLMR